MIWCFVIIIFTWITWLYNKKYLCMCNVFSYSVKWIPEWMLNQLYCTFPPDNITYILRWTGYPDWPVINLSHSCRIFEPSPSLITARKYAFPSVGRLVKTHSIPVLQEKNTWKNNTGSIHWFNVRRQTSAKIEHKIWYTLYEKLCSFCSMFKKYCPFSYSEYTITIRLRTSW